MLPDRVSNPGPLTYESGALPIALRGPAQPRCHFTFSYLVNAFEPQHDKADKVACLPSEDSGQPGPEVIKLFSCATHEISNSH